MRSFYTVEGGSVNITPPKYTGEIDYLISSGISCRGYYFKGYTHRTEGAALLTTKDKYKHQWWLLSQRIISSSVILLIK